MTRTIPRLDGFGPRIPFWCYPDDPNVVYAKEARQGPPSTCITCGKQNVAQVLRAHFRSRKVWVDWCPRCKSDETTKIENLAHATNRRACRNCGNTFTAMEWTPWVLFGWECLHHTVTVACECCGVHFEVLDLPRDHYPIYCLICYNERLGGEEAE